MTLFTTDFFTPVVDDPFAFGQIAAANSLSDIYAMGGEPALALNLAAFPVRKYGTETLVEILLGGAEKAREAGCLLAGGHTIDDPEPKYGLCVIGYAQEGKLIKKGQASPGDHLYLTKPIGTGILATAFKNGELEEGGFAEAVASMIALNAAAGRVAVSCGIKSGTDVTGFGLLGHLLEICSESAVSAEISFSSVPFFDGVEKFALEEEIPGGTRANLEHVRPKLSVIGSLPEHRLLMLADAQTSGGLLLAVPEGKKDQFKSEMALVGRACWRVGSVLEGPAGIEIKP